MMTKLSRLGRVTELTGLARSSIYDRIADGLFPPPIKITERCSAWPEAEIEAINKARIAGTDDEGIRRLVAELVEARKQA